MRTIMVKKILDDGSLCRKCDEATERLEKMNLMDRIDEILIIEEGNPGSPGMAMALRLGVDRAPFFVVEEDDGSETVYLSVMQLIRKRLEAPTPDALDIDGINGRLETGAPQKIIQWALGQFGKELAIAFSGAEDVALIDMASKTGLPFSVFCLDTGRLHDETLAFVEAVESHYQITIERVTPDAAAVQALVEAKGLNSFYEDGHQECCGIRKVTPLKKTLATRLAWMTGQRTDQNPATRTSLPVVQADPAFDGKGDILVKVNPLVHWKSEDVWRYLKEESVPVNPLHDQGYRSIGCEPCTRPIEAHQHEREGRWWWENPEAKECGLHLDKSNP